MRNAVLASDRPLEPLVAVILQFHSANSSHVGKAAQDVDVAGHSRNDAPTPTQFPAPRINPTYSPTVLRVNLPAWIAATSQSISATG